MADAEKADRLPAAERKRLKKEPGLPACAGNNTIASLFVVGGGGKGQGRGEGQEEC